MTHLFITGIPTAGKSYLAAKLAKKYKGLHVELDDLRENLATNPKYEKWVNFYVSQDEHTYLTETSKEQQWQDLVSQSEALWPALLEEINKYKADERLVVFESVNILPHLARRDLEFGGVVLIGRSFEEVLARNIENPRWGDTLELQELEAKHFFYVEREGYRNEANEHEYPAFDIADDAYRQIITYML